MLAAKCLFISMSVSLKMQKMVREGKVWDRYGKVRKGKERSGKVRKDNES